MAQAQQVVRMPLATLAVSDHAIDGDVAAHRSATIESGAVLKGPAVASGANAVLAPGTLLPPDTVVGRCHLVDQDA